jgi:GTP-binding protein EngB required for normal cell division
MIELDDKALDIIADCDLPVGFVVFTGKYRIGKSSLMNRLLRLRGDGFKVSSSMR